MEPYSGDTNVIAKVGTTPEDRGLETEDFKAKFDEGLTAFVQWFNTTHKTEFEAHLAESSFKHITDSGSNANGSYVKFDNGVMECWAEREFTRVTANSLKSDWYFPKSFISTDYDIQLTLISPNLRGAYTGGVDGIGHVYVRLMGTAYATLQIQSASGFSWVSTDTLFVKCRAIGRWKN